MDVTASYRTRAPPKEHEEAVRMLLESIANKKQEPGGGRIVTNSKLQRSSDTGSLHTNSSSSASSAGVSYRKPLNNLLNNNNANLSKTTSTNEDTISTKTSSSFQSKSTSTGDEEILHDAYRQPIPSRTIAVQCDLKLSSVRKAEAGMQACSISSTKFGFYDYSQEFLDRRRKLHEQELESLNSIDNSVAKKLTGNGLGQMEAPTSMSELSSSSSSLTQIQSQTHQSKQAPKQMYRSEGFIGQKHKLSSNRDLPAEAGGSSSYLVQDDPRVSRTRLDSLPRRPMTALSYVSSNQLRGLPNDHESSCDELISGNRARPIKSHHRAHSQQVLSAAPSSSSSIHSTLINKNRQQQARGPANSSININNDNANYQASSAESDCSDCQNNNQSDQFRVPCTEEVLLTKRGQPIAGSRAEQRPILLKSSHNEQVEELNLNHDPNRTLTRPPQTKMSSRPLQRLGRPEVDESNSYEQEDSQTAGEEEEEEEAYEQRVATLGRRFVNDYGNSQAASGLARRSDARSRSMYSKNPLGSMSLTRKPPAQRELYRTRYNNNNPTLPVDSAEGAPFASAGRRSQTLSRSGLANSQQTLPNSMRQQPSYRSSHFENGGELPARSQTRIFSSREPEVEPVTRSTSMRHIHSAVNYGAPSRDEYQLESEEGPLHLDDSDSPSTRTWANPGEEGEMIGQRRIRRNQTERYESDRETRRNGQAFYGDVRNINHASDLEKDNLMKTSGLYNYNYRYQDDDSHSTTSSSMEQTGQNFIRSQQLDYDSQHRLNESGLPEVHPSHSQLNPTTGNRRPSAPSSYIGLPTIHNNGSINSAKNEVNQFAAYTMGRPPKITGRAMSQQSLTRPTMTGLLTGRRRRRAGGSNSGSDVGGSSMSLVSRLNGRYENAHTRTPVIMYIPQATPKPATSSTSLIDRGSSRASFLGKSSTLRKSMKSSGLSSSKLSSKSSSQDKLKRTNGSRNGSDSESSSMLRTLVKPRGSRSGSRRGAGSSSNRFAGNHYDYDNENEDSVGQLMTEMEGYKFKRRYSVPKDAKINWFAKLKQKVSPSSGSK